jgi:DNA-binding transcriptional ArsR family regulator
MNVVDSLASVSKALGDELRLEILHVLRTESFGVLELCRILSIRQNALSHHLKILATAGLVSSRREGNSHFYRRVLLLPEDPFISVKQSDPSSLCCFLSDMRSDFWKSRNWLQSTPITGTPCTHYSRDYIYRLAHG